jgi:hypothetical protein
VAGFNLYTVAFILVSISGSFQDIHLALCFGLMIIQYPFILIVHSLTIIMSVPSFVIFPTKTLGVNIIQKQTPPCPPVIKPQTDLPKE